MADLENTEPSTLSQPPEMSAPKTEAQPTALEIPADALVLAQPTITQTEVASDALVLAQPQPEAHPDIPAPQTTEPPKPQEASSAPQTEREQAFSRIQNGKNLYEQLGVAPDADLKTIQKAWRKASLLVHPDKNPDNKEVAEEATKRLNNAFDILKEADNRAAYDRAQARQAQQPQQAQEPQAQEPQAQEPQAQQPQAQEPQAQQPQAQQPQQFEEFMQSQRSQQAQRSLRQSELNAESAFNLSAPQDTYERPNLLLQEEQQVSEPEVVVAHSKNIKDLLETFQETFGHDSWYQQNPPQVNEDSTVSMSFKSSEDVVLFANKMAEKGQTFVMRNSDNQVVAYSNGDGKLYNGDKSEYTAGQGAFKPGDAPQPDDDLANESTQNNAPR